MCHTLESAESVGKIGPNLDQLRPTAGRIERAIENGVGAMPAYGGKLTPNEIKLLSRFVNEATHRGAKP